jgi:hypothetical protein
VVAHHNGKLIGGTDNLLDIDVLPSKFFENMVIYTRTESVLCGELDSYRR